jgi:hypothetical protein
LLKAEVALHSSQLSSVSTASLLDGVRIDIKGPLDAGRIQLWPGTEPASDVIYWKPSFVPRGSPRSPSSSELDALLHVRGPWHGGDSVAIVAVPPSIREKFKPLSVLLARKAGESGAIVTSLSAGPKDDIPLKSAAGRIGAAFCSVGPGPMKTFHAVVEDARRFALETSHSSTERMEPRSLGALSRSAGLLTCTYDEQNRCLIGLHIDNFFARPLDSRSAAPNRLCINIGDSPRYLLFINLTLLQIQTMLRGGGVGETDLTQADWRIDRLFLSRFPDYPVVQLRIDPGEAYIAPTENLIHDSTTFGLGGPEASITLLGRFEARPLMTREI